MAKYKFPKIGLEIINPEIIIHGRVGTRVLKGVPQLMCFAEIQLKIKDGMSFGYTLEHESVPKGWDIGSIEEWVGERLKEYEV